MATFGPSFTRRRRPSSPTKSPRFYHPVPSFPVDSTLLHGQNVKQVPNRSASRTPRPMTPQETFYSSYMLQQGQYTGTAPMQMPRTPQIRPFSPAPSSGVSSVRSLSDSDSDSDTEMVMMRPSLQIIMQEPETSEDEGEVDIPEISATTKTSERQSSITIEELPSTLSSPLSTPSLSQGEVWGDSGLLSIDIEVLKGDYSSALSDGDDTEAATTTDFRTDEDDDEDDTFNEWSIDICSSSYPTDAFLLGGFSSLSTGMPVFPQVKPMTSASNSGTYGRSEGKKFQSCASPRPSGSSRKRSYAWTEDSDSDGDDESDGGSKKSPRKKMRRRVTIDHVVDTFAEAEDVTAAPNERKPSSVRWKNSVKKRRPVSYPGIEGVFHSSAEMDLDN